MSFRITKTFRISIDERNLDKLEQAVQKTARLKKEFIRIPELDQFAEVLLPDTPNWILIEDKFKELDKAWREVSFNLIHF